MDKRSRRRLRAEHEEDFAEPAPQHRLRLKSECIITRERKVSTPKFHLFKDDQSAETRAEQDEEVVSLHQAHRQRLKSGRVSMMIWTSVRRNSKQRDLTSEEE